MKNTNKITCSLGFIRSDIFLKILIKSPSGTIKGMNVPFCKNNISKYDDVWLNYAYPEPNDVEGALYPLCISFKDDNYHRVYIELLKKLIQLYNTTKDNKEAQYMYTNVHFVLWNKVEFTVDEMNLFSYFISDMDDKQYGLALSITEAYNCFKRVKCIMAKV